MTDQQDEEPDRVHTCALSRRHALAVSAGALGSLAGCSGVAEQFSGTSEPTTERPPLSETLVTSAEFSIDEAVLELNIASYDPDALAGTLRLYSAPNLDHDDQTLVAERSIDQTERVAEYVFEPDYDLGYAQQFQFTVEPDDGDGERVVYTTEQTILPFYNAARDEEMLLTEPPRKPTAEEWVRPRERVHETKLWFDEPEERPFDTPAVPDEEYDSDWYPTRDLTVTAVVRFPTYENLVEAEVEDTTNFGFGVEEDDTFAVPLREWAVFNVRLGAWELLEAFRWNSRATQELEAGKTSYGDGFRKVSSPKMGGSVMRSNKFIADGAAGRPPYAVYYATRHTQTDYRPRTNPLLFAAGRPVCKRAAESIAASLDNPSFGTLDYPEYHKALALQLFVGKSPYSFGLGSYSSSPEETLNAWYENRDVEGGAGNCQDTTYLYCGIAVHLLDVPLCSVSLRVQGAGHLTAGLVDVDRPNGIAQFENHPEPVATEPFTLTTERGTVSVVESTVDAPITGWRLSSSAGYELATYLRDAPINSHVPLNDDYEPAADGEVRASLPENVELGDGELRIPIEVTDPEVPWEFHENHETIGDVDAFS